MRKIILMFTILTFLLSANTELYAQFGGGRGLYYYDADQDGYGDPTISTPLIPQNSWWVDNDDDCDDTDANITTGPTWFIDNDGDGFGEITNFKAACTQPTGYVNNNLDQCPEQYGLANGCPGQIGPSNDQNYVHTISYQEPFSIGQENSANDGDKIETISYFDGIGRPVQDIAIRSGGNNEDIITHIEYDLAGRQAKEFLPHTALTNKGAYRTGAGAATDIFYNTTKYQNTTNPYSEKHFEDAPLNRLEEQGAPGNSWVINKSNDGDHTVKFEYKTNNTSNEVRLYIVSLTSDYTPTLNSSGYYDDFSLTKTITKDENWKSNDGANKTAEEFMDKQDRVILKRSYNNSQKHDTYYVYDKYGNLTFVLPPKSEPTGDKPNNTELTELCYQYKYDKRNRLVKKKIPGKDWEYLVYDNLDRPVLTQDGMQRVENNVNLTINEWLFTKYDAFGRVAYTGIYSSDMEDQSSLQTIFDGKIAVQNYETKTTNSGYEGTYYTNGGFPNSSIEILTVNYYDNYTFNRAGASTTANSYGINSSTNVKTLATGTRAKVLGTSNWITSITYFDKKALPIYSYTKNDYLSTTDIVKSKLDFTGRVLETTTLHTKNGNATITSIDKFIYDDVGRMLKQTQKINTQEEELIVQNTYNELGQLEKKGVGHLASNTTNRLQEIDFTYNVRGWLTKINDVTNLGTDLFSFSILYDNVGNSLYNGNISETQWRTANTDSSLKTYTYVYDDLNRITGATDNSSNYNLTSVTYDKNGNIQSLNRKGHINVGATLFGNMDLLNYEYETNSNKLKKVTDTSGKVQGFNDGANVAEEYKYDVNGNLILDANKNITHILYNHLNLPTEIKFENSNTKKINYTYSADGTKVRKVVNDNNNITTTDYMGNYVYENEILQFFKHDEGYVTINGSSWRYVYQYTDHLGSVRLTYSDEDNNGTISQSELVEENSYYPYGLKMQGFNTGVNSLGNSVAQRYKFNGKEFDESFQSLNTYDFGARNYDPAIARWMNVDPLADLLTQYDKSPFAYAWDNPVFFIDPDGESPCPPGVNCENPLPNMQRIRVNRASNLGAGDVRTNRDGSKRWHAGHDLHASAGTNVRSSMAGEVVAEGTNASYGNYVTIKTVQTITETVGGVETQTTNTFYTFYAHLETTTVDEGDTVTAGQNIGTVGTTGNADDYPDDPNNPNIHLHFEIGTELRDNSDSFLKKDALLDANEGYKDVSFNSQNPNATRQNNLGVIKTQATTKYNPVTGKNYQQIETTKQNFGTRSANGTDSKPNIINAQDEF